MVNFNTIAHDENPSSEGRKLPSMVSTCGAYMIRPLRESGGIAWTLDAPGTRETFRGGSHVVRLADAITRADTLAAIDRTIDLRGL